MTVRIFDLETLLLSHCEIKKKSLQTPLLPVVGFPETKFHQKSYKRLVCTDSRKQISKRGTEMFSNFKSPFPLKSVISQNRLKET